MSNDVVPINKGKRNQGSDIQNTTSLEDRSVLAESIGDIIARTDWDDPDFTQRRYIGSGTVDFQYFQKLKGVLL